jgi:hypothetical protein
LHHKKKSHRLRKVCGESSDVNGENIEDWIKKNLPGVILRYEYTDIFNVDETVHFYSLMPIKTLTIKGKTHAGGYKFKDWLTTLLCCNVNGTVKMKPLITEKFAKPRLKNNSTFPCQYSNNLNTRHLMQEWGAVNMWVLLFTGKCLAHSAGTGFFRNTQVISFPPRLQPLDPGVIHSLKAKYRTVLVHNAIAAIQNKTGLKLNILQAMHIVVAVWNSKGSAAVRNCFTKAGTLVIKTLRKIMRRLQ